MAREHRDRYASMTDVLADLERLEKGHAPSGPHADFSFRRFAQTRGRILAGTACILAVLMLAALGVNRWQRGFRLDPIHEFSPPRAANWVNAQVGDWDGDGETDILQIEEGSLRAFSKRGEPFKPLPLEKPGDVDLHLGLLADITNDGMDEAFVTWNRGTNAYLAAYNQLGWPVKQFVVAGSLNVHPQHGTNYTKLRPRLVTDLDNDGRQELLCIVTSTWALHPRGLYCFDIETAKLNWAFETAGFVADIALCDLDGDQRQELLLGSNANGNGSILPDGTDDEHAYLFVLSSGGKLLWRHELAGLYASVNPIQTDSTNRTATVWIRDGHQLSHLKNELETGKILAFNAAGTRIHECDFGVELTSALAADLKNDGHQEFLIADRFGVLHVLDENLQERQSVTVAKPKQPDVEEVSLQLAATKDFGQSASPFIVLTSTRIEHLSEPQTGANRETPEAPLYHDNCVIVLDSTLNTVASHTIAKKWSLLQNPAIRIKLLDRGPAVAPDILVLGLKAHVLRLTNTSPSLFGRW